MAPILAELRPELHLVAPRYFRAACSHSTVWFRPRLECSSVFLVAPPTIFRHCTGQNCSSPNGPPPPPARKPLLLPSALISPAAGPSLKYQNRSERNRSLSPTDRLCGGRL